MSLVSSINCTAFPEECETERRNAALSLGIIGMISAFSVLCILFSMFYFRLYIKMRNRLIIYLFIADLCQTTCAMTSFAWIGNPPQQGNLACIYQGWCWTFWNAAAPLWSAAIALFVGLSLYSTTFCCYCYIPFPGKKFEMATHLIWIIAFAFAVPGFFLSPKDFFIPVTGIECWINPQYEIERLFVHAWIIIVFSILTIIYTLLVLYLCKYSQKFKEAPEAESLADKSTIIKLALFPLTFLLSYPMQTILRFLNSYGINVPVRVTYVGICLVAADGFLNSLLYGYSRRLFSNFCGGCCLKKKKKKKYHQLEINNYS